MEMEVEIWADQKVERTGVGAKRKSSESFDVTLTTKLANGRSQRKKTSVEVRFTDGSGNMLKMVLRRWKTEKRPAIIFQHCIQANPLLKKNG